MGHSTDSTRMAEKVKDSTLLKIDNSLASTIYMYTRLYGSPHGNYNEKKIISEQRKKIKASCGRKSSKHKER